MSTLDNWPDDWLVVSESESSKDKESELNANTEEFKKKLDDLASEIGPFETIKGPEDINKDNIKAVTRAVFDAIREGKTGEYQNLISALNIKITQIVKNKTGVTELAEVFEVAETNINAVLQDNKLQNVLAWTEFYNGKEPYKDALKKIFVSLFPGEELLILKNNTPEENFKLWNFEGLTMDDTEALKKTLETRAKEKTTDSIKTYFGARWKVEEELEQINSTTKEYISYVKIDGTSFKRKLQDFQLESYKKTIEESLQQTYYEEQRIQLNKILKAAWKPTID